MVKCQRCRTLFLLALVGQWLGHLFPLVGGPVFALLIGMACIPIFQVKMHFSQA